MRPRIAVNPGDVFGDWTVIEEVGSRQYPCGALMRMVRCRCGCGTVSDVDFQSLRAGRSRRCYACGRRTEGVLGTASALGRKHGRANGEANRGRRRDGRINYAGGTGRGAHPREGSSWVAMLRRCLDDAAPDYRFYGGRGVTVCDRWLPDVAGQEAFQNFLADMGPRPEGASLDRIDPWGNYTPENCRWADAKTQAKNKRRRRDTTPAAE